MGIVLILLHECGRRDRSAILTNDGHDEDPAKSCQARRRHNRRHLRPSDPAASDKSPQFETIPRDMNCADQMTNPTDDENRGCCEYRNGYQ